MSTTTIERPKVDPLADYRSTADAYLAAKARALALPWDHPGYPAAHDELVESEGDMAYLLTLPGAPLFVVHAGHHFALRRGELEVRPRRDPVKVKAEKLGRAAHALKTPDGWRDAG